MRLSFLSVLFLPFLASCASPDLACLKIETRLGVIRSFCEDMALKVALSNCEGDPAGDACVAVQRAAGLKPCQEMAGLQAALWAQETFCD